MPATNPKKDPTYFHHLTAFWRNRVPDIIGANAVKLYFALLDEANQLHWPKSFILSHRYIIGKANMDGKTYRTARASLVECGLLTVDSKERFKTVTITLTLPKCEGIIPADGEGIIPAVTPQTPESEGSFPRKHTADTVVEEKEHVDNTTTCEPPKGKETKVENTEESTKRTLSSEPSSLNKGITEEKPLPKNKAEKSYPFDEDDKKRATYLLDMIVSENAILKVPDEDLPRQYNAMYLLRTHGAPKYKSKTTEVPRIARPITGKELNDVLRWLKGTENGQWWWKATANLQNAVSFHRKFAILLLKFLAEGKDEQGQAQQQDTWVTNIIR